MTDRKHAAFEGSKPIPVKLDATLTKRIQDLATKIGEPKSTVMRMCMRIGLDQLEKVYDINNPPTGSSSSGDRIEGKETDRPKKTPKKLPPELSN